MILKSNFDRFLSDIRPTATQRAAMRRGHRALRDRLADDEKLSPVIVATFIQGSYRRATAVRPAEGQRSDVDVVVVTTIPSTTPAAEAQGLFYDFTTRHYAGKWEPQDRSIGINLSDVDLDLVITSAPSEMEAAAVKSYAAADTLDLSESADDRDYAGLDAVPWLIEQAKSAQWKQEPLYIPNRALSEWGPTHPIAQIVWTRAKNAATNGHYINVVKALKWWKRNNPNLMKHPKGYPLEHLIGQCYPTGIGSIAEGVLQTLESIVHRYGVSGAFGIVPDLRDHGVPSHNVMQRVTSEEFRIFITEITKARDLARTAYNAQTEAASSKAWQDLFGSKFPLSSGTSTSSLMANAVAPAVGLSSQPTIPKGPKGFA